MTSECHSLSYDTLTAHLCIVLCRYIMLAIEQRCSTDERTMGELFRFAVDEIRDITLAEALFILWNSSFPTARPVWRLHLMSLLPY
ncbi:MAG: hypothetical protein HDQ87_08330 [Clostridia bacterium]|nr:hypothetical protein [Clostridia bacterium]